MPKYEFTEFLCDFRLQHTFQERTAPKVLEIDQDSLQYEIFITKRVGNFHLFKFWPSVFKEFSVRRRQIQVPFKMRAFGR